MMQLSTISLVRTSTIFFFSNYNISEANDLKKAVEAAIRAKEWPKALSVLLTFFESTLIIQLFQIVENIQDQKIRTGYYGEIADHYSSKGEFEVFSNISDIK